MECGKIREILGFYAEGALIQHEMQAVGEHLAECAECERELTAITLLLSAAGAVEDVDPPSNLRASIYAATTQRKAATEHAGVGFIDRLKGAFEPARVRWATGAVAAGLVAFAIIVGGPNYTPEQTLSSSQTPSTSAQVSEVEPMPASPSESPAVASQSSSTDRSRTTSGVVAKTPPAPGARRVAKQFTKSPRTSAKAQLVAKMPAKPAAKVNPVTQHKLPAVVEPPVEVESEVVVDVRDYMAEEVALAPEPEPMTEPHAIREVRDKVTAATTAPVLKREDMKAMLEQAKAMSAAVRQARRPAGISFVKSNF